MALGINFYKFKKNNLLVTFGVVSLLAVLLFLPEIIGLEGGIDLEKGRFSLRPPSSTGADPFSVAEIEEQASGTDIQPAEDPRARLNPVSNNYSYQEQEFFDRERQREQIFPAEQVTWETLHSDEVAENLKQVQVASFELLNQIPSDKKQARWALFNYVNGINMILGNPPQSLKAEDALKFLEELDLGVTEAFVKDDVARAARMDWAEVSLTPVLGQRRAEIEKRQAITPFNPRIRVIDLGYRITATNTGSFPTGREFTEGVMVDFTLAMRGREIKEIELHRNGEYQYDLPIHTPKFEDDWGYIETYVTEPAFSRFSIVVIDVEGQEYVKHYDFRRDIGRFGWKYVVGGNYYLARLPYVTRKGRIDPRIDPRYRVSEGLRRRKAKDGKLYRVGQTSSGFFGLKENSGYVAF